MKKISNLLVVLIILLSCPYAVRAADESAEPNELQIIEAPADIASSEQQPQLALSQPLSNSDFIDPLKYTIGPEDVVQIDVMRHPEFSGVYPINREGKLQYKFVGDIEVNGLTKKELEDKIKEVLSVYLISPEINVTVVEYKSKVIYVLGEVGQPGKYYMRSESIPVREAVMQAGLPTQAAAMRKSRIITPAEKGKVRTKRVDLYSVLYGGNLKYNYEMHAGDVLYVPCTVMAKVIRMISPVSTAVGVSASTPEGVSTGRTAASSLAP